jgi:glutamate synthase domain-containing protein 2/glutamate synthase domain-containing protein 1/glutamate synthase domain-containing protein 3
MDRSRPAGAEHRHPRDLYDPAFEHDACGVGFVADAGPTPGDRVLPLALAGLAALGHRGAFAADGESSDGAGVLLPLDPAVVRRLAPGLGRHPGIVTLFLSRTPRVARRARRLVADTLAGEGLRVAAWREVPMRLDTLGPAAAAGAPLVVQALVPRPIRVRRGRFELDLLVARRRLETAAMAAGLDVTVVSASSRTVVYKGLVAGARLGDLYPDLVAPMPVRFAVFHQRYATNTRPVWSLAQPFRFLAHNGEINTVRGNRLELAGRMADPARSAAARRLLAAGSLTSAGGSDSLSLDEAVELLAATGWRTDQALLALLRESLPMRSRPLPAATAFASATEGFVAPWDGPAAIVFSDGRRVGAIVDRNGLRPLAFAVTRDHLVVAASEAGAVPLAAGDTVRRGRLGPGELLLVDPDEGLVLEDPEAKHAAIHGSVPAAGSRPVHRDPPFGDRAAGRRPSMSQPLRWLAGLDAERARLDIRTMALDEHEPLWSMGDDTPLPSLGRVERPLSDHLRQAFAQVTNPPIDPERERLVMDPSVVLGRRAPLLGGIPAGPPRSVRLERPVIADLDPLEASLEAAGLRVRRLDATWDARLGSAGLRVGVDRLARAARSARADVLVLHHRRIGLDRPPIPSALAAGAVHTALTGSGRRGLVDIVAEAADVLDVHGLAMTLAAGARAVIPSLAVELAAELAGSRGAEDLRPAQTVERLMVAFEAGLRKTLARMGISTAASYVGAELFETVELGPDVLERCFPAAAAWPGTQTFEELAERQLRRVEAGVRMMAQLPRVAAGAGAHGAAGAAPQHGAVAAGAGADAAVGRPIRLPDLGLARYRADGEVHLYAPPVVSVLQGRAAERDGRTAPQMGLADRPPATVRDAFRLRRRRPVPLDEVEPASAVLRRFVASAMSVGALSPEAHQAVTIGMQALGGAANTGEGGEDPAWYVRGPDGRRHDARIKQVASARFGVTAQYLARADQLEIKIAQGSKPGEGGQLPGRKATAYIASLRRAQPGQTLISPPPHHDIYSIEDLAQLIADLRSINPRARIGVKLVASRGVGTVAAGVAKAGADYVHIGGHAGGTGASPLSSIKHAGAPWELGLAEAHQTLLRNGLRDRVALRTDGGLQTGRDLLIAALLGAEEFGFGTAALVAIGCDMARQCHLDTCPTGIATQREDLRAKFTGSPGGIERFFTDLAEDLRRELAAIGARSVGEIVGEAGRHLRAAPASAAGPLLRAPRWRAGVVRRAEPGLAAALIPRQPASSTEMSIVAGLRAGSLGPTVEAEVTTADRSFGAVLSGALERAEIAPQVGRIRIGLRGSAGQSLGAFLTVSVALTLEGLANDYVGKGLGGGSIVIRPEPGLAAPAAGQTIAGNACLYGATGGRLHIVGRAGIRFAVRNSGAEAVVEGLGAHGCEYMTGGVVVVLGPIGANFGAGMTGGRAYVLDPAGRRGARVSASSVSRVRLSVAARERADGAALVTDLRRLLEDHAEAGSELAGRLLRDGTLPLDDVWLIEPVAARAAEADAPAPDGAAASG